MLKKFLSCMISAALLVSLSACSSEVVEDDGKLKITATNFALYDFAYQVCGDFADVSMLITVETESHDFEASLGDIAKISSSDLFIHTGGESEDWVDDIFASFESSDVELNSICAADLVETYDEEIIEGMQQTETEEGEEEVEEDEHVWTSIPNAIVIINEIAENVSRIAPDMEEEIRRNAEEYTEKLMKIDAEIENCVNSAKRKTIIVADRFPFRYFTERYSLDYYAAFSGCTSNVEPTLSTINFLIEKVREEEIPDVLKIEFSDGKCASAVSDETGCGVLELHSAHNVTKEDFENGVTYAEIMGRNLAVLKDVLN